MNTGKIIRRIKKNKLWFALNALGLTIAFACLILVYSFVKMEFSYDRFHEKSDRIYRITENSNTGISSMIDARLQTRLSWEFEKTFPEIESIVRLNSYRNAIVSIGEESFYSKKVFAVDSTFFNIFSFDLLLGNKETVFNHPKQVVLSESMALNYFGTIDIIGEKLEIIHQKSGMLEEFTIEGIIKDAPQNTHFKYDILTSKEESVGNTLDFTYLLLTPNSSSENLKEAIQTNWDKTFEEYDYHPLVNLQAITDIHLKSDKTREMEKNGSYRSIWLLLSGMIIILIISFINYSNLNFVQFINDNKMHKIKMVNGAKRVNLVLDSIKESSFLILLILVIALGIAQQFSKEYQFTAFLDLPYFHLSLLILIFIGFVVINAIWPFYTYGFKQVSGQNTLKQKKSYKIFVIFQLSLAFIALSSIIILQKQLNHIKTLHPEGNSLNMVAMPNNSFDVVKDYDVYKERLLKYPDIYDVTAVMEEPAGTVTDNFPYEVEGKEKDASSTINILSVDSNFFSFFKINPIAGRVDFTNKSKLDWEIKVMREWRREQQGLESSEEFKEEVLNFRAEYIINKTALAHLGFENAEDALGKKFRFDFMGAMFPYGEIIAVVDDFHYTNLYTKEKPIVIVNRRLFTHCFLIKINGENKTKVLDILRKEWEVLNPDFPFNYEFVSDAYQKVYAKEFQLARVLSLFTIISIILAAMGLFAMVTFNLERRSKEIGLRKISGATISEVLLMLLRSYTKWMLIAFIIGIPITYFMMKKWLESFAYQTTIDLYVFLLAGLLTWLISILTVGLISFKTARRNPVESIRYE